MNTFTTWSPPVAVSLLLHAALIVLITHRLSSTETVRNPSQTITVEMLNSRPAAEIKPRSQKAAPAVSAKPVQEPLKVEQPPETGLPEKVIETAAPTSEQSRNPVTESSPGRLNIQPLSKLTRPPAFLHKIEPVYPLSEQRAGSQAYVLAEVTINDQGKVLEVKIMKSAGTAFDNAVTEALGKSIFTPGYIGKEAVAVRVLVPFRFNLR